MEAWNGFLDILILLTAALVMGALAEQLRQSAIIGYLLAGMLVGPNVFAWVKSSDSMDLIADLGAALLLFTIGLEFSARRLVRLGPVAFVGGTLQIVITALAAWVAAGLFGLDARAALVVGFMAAMSSTACVMRVLHDHTLTESVFGRTAFGVLLLQDLAVVPLVLLVAALGEGTPLGQAGWKLAKTGAAGAGAFAVLYPLFNYVLPTALQSHRWTRNRELPILLAVILSLGSAWGAHALGLSPAFGAFLSGMLLAESPFAVQIRADVYPLRTVLVTLFFAAIGIWADPKTVAAHWILVASVVALIVLGKTFVVWGVLRMFHLSHGAAVAAGLTLSQIGEFSFVLGKIAAIGDPAVLSPEVFRLLASITCVTLFVTPYLVAAAPRVSRWIDEAVWRRFAWRSGAGADVRAAEDVHKPSPIVIIGFGPAAQRVAQLLAPRHRADMVIVDANPRNALAAKALGVEFHVGDATGGDVLEHVNVPLARAVVVTTPDPTTSRHIIELCRALAPEARIIARSRYSRFQEDFRQAGAAVVVDEEEQAGLRIAAELEAVVRSP